MLSKGNLIYVPICFFLLPLDLTWLKNLKVLDLSVNYVEGSIPPAIANLTTLVALSLSENNLIGALPSQGKT